MNRIGIMGGTFNPIHNGHLAIAQAAREQFALDKVLFMPSGVPYMKNLREVLPASVRCEMTALAIRDIPYFELSDLEAVAEGNTYTCRTLEQLKSLHPDTDFYFLLGADSLYAIETWKRPEQIFKSCTILAAVRRETAGRSEASTANAAEGDGYDGDLGGTALQRRLLEQIRYLREKYGALVEMLEIPEIDISSTRIRHMLLAGNSVQGVLPAAVESYITKNHLYRG